MVRGRAEDPVVVFLRTACQAVAVDVRVIADEPRVTESGDADPVATALALWAARCERKAMSIAPTLHRTEASWNS